jgi:hypothetical protein
MENELENVYELTEFDKEHYRFGACHLFSLALHQELGYDMYFFWESLPNMNQLNEENPETLIHAFAISSKGDKFDVDGKTNDEKIGSTYAKVDYSTVRKETKESVDKLIWSGILALWSYDAGEVEELRKYIRKNIQRYR